MLMPSSVISFGDSIGKYRFIAEAATGGMGIIYLAARHGPAGFSQLVAVKELRPEFAQDPSYVAMFLEEGRSAARFTHPNIVQTLETDQCDGRYFIAMEYLEGRSLQRIKQRFLPRGGLPMWMSLSILCDVLSALDYVHELQDHDGRPLGFVHRDVSPQNIFVTFDGHTKVIDFGIAKSRDSAQQTQNGVLKGRLCYMAPEQLAHDASRRSDIFSVGAILFEIVTGRRLWHGQTDVSIFGHLTRGEIPPPDPTADAPPLLLQICQKALAARAEDRFASAGEMREALSDFLWRSGARDLRASHSIGNAIVEAFGDERERTRLLIRTYFAQLERGYHGPLQKLSLQERVATGAPIPGFPTASPIVLTGNDFADFEIKTVETPALLLTTGAYMRRLWSQYGKIAGAIAGVALLLGVIIGYWPRAGVHSSKLLPTGEPLATPAAVAPPLALPAQPETIVLSVTASPANSQIFIDGQPMPSNPFLGRFPTNTATHRVRVAAPGYFPKERLVSFADNVMLDLSLNPRPEPRENLPRRREPAPLVRHVAPPPPVAPPPVVATPARPAPPTDILPRTSIDKARKRRIEAANPYEGDQ